jgi:hypothetical protein
VDCSPDGEYMIAVMKFKDQVDIYRGHADRTGLENPTKDLGKLLGAGSKPIFISDVIDGSEVYMFTDEGGAGSRNLGSNWGAGDFDPEFSPEGRNVSFQSPTLASMNPAGCGFRPAGNKAVQGISGWSKDNFYPVEKRKGCACVRWIQ